MKASPPSHPALVLADWGDEGIDDLNDGDYSFPDESHSDTDSSEDEFADETATGNLRCNPNPVAHQSCDSNQFGEMIGRAAQFGKPYPVHHDQGREAEDKSKGSTKNPRNSAFNCIESCHSNFVSYKTTRSSRSSASRSRGKSRDATTAVDDDCQEMKRAQKRLSGSGGLRGRGSLSRMWTDGKPSKHGRGERLSDLDDDDDSASDPSDSEDDDVPDIELGFGMNTRVFMADGTTKRIKKIQPGEYVLGPDRMPRLVTSTSTWRSSMIQIRELTQNIVRQPDFTDNHLGLVTFTCTPNQVLRLATAQCQIVYVYHDVKHGVHQVRFRQLKRMQDSMIVVHSSKSFQDSLPNAREEVDACAQSRSKDVIYWSLPQDCHDIVSKVILLQPYHLTTAIDFGTGRLQYHALKLGFRVEIGTPEKLAYLWGTWTGDGDSACTRIAVNRKDREQIRRIEDTCYNLGLAAKLCKHTECEKARGSMGGVIMIASRVHKRCNYFLTFLRRLGFSKPGSKYVPRWLRKESISVREHFLAELTDSDGCCTKQRDSNGATPHHRDKSQQSRLYQDVTIVTIYLAIAEGVFILARSHGIPYSSSRSPARFSRNQPLYHIGLQPSSALTNILSLCAVDTKWQPASITFVRHHIEYRYGLLHQEVVDAIHRMPNIPAALPRNQDEETRALINQSDYPTLTLLGKRYHNFDHNHDQIHERLGLSTSAISAYFSSKGYNKKWRPS
ncbi:H(+)-transporting V1 sector ATPase subunit A [Mortierella alpina]|nr:H(+)-transporting V1 sector ATPase subunit A [Mortierella alpina]